MAENPGLEIVPSSDHTDIINGQGTMATEFIDEVGHLDHLLVGVSGGGAASGVAIAAKALLPDCQVYGVEPQNCADASVSFKTDVITYISPGRTICDSAMHSPISPMVH